MSFDSRTVGQPRCKTTGRSSTHTAMAMRGMTGYKLDNMMKTEAHLHNYAEEYIKKHDETLFDWRAGAVDPRWGTRMAHEFARDGCYMTSQTLAKLRDTVNAHDTK